MPEERKRQMSIEEIEAALVGLPDEQLDGLWDRVMSQRIGSEDEIDPAVLAEARRRVHDMKSGQVAPVPFEQVLDHLDRVTAAALELREEEREEVIATLASHRSRPPAVRQAWLDEAEQRMELVRSGKMRLLNADEVLADPEYDA
jgi:hypothetical protein